MSLGSTGIESSTLYECQLNCGIVFGVRIAHDYSMHTTTHGNARRHFISAAIKHPGALRATLGVKAGQKIPAAKLAAAAQEGGVTGRRARFAQTLARLRKK